MTRTFTIAEAASQAGMSVDVLRYTSGGVDACSCGTCSVNGLR